MIWTPHVKLPLAESTHIRLIEIDSNASFLDLHLAILDAVSFDHDHLFEFYVGRHPRNRAYSIGGEPNWDAFDPFDTYEDIRLSDAWPLPKGMKLFYLFDFGDNWLFQIYKMRHKDKQPLPGTAYPRVIQAEGDNPEQYPDWEE